MFSSCTAWCSWLFLLSAVFVESITIDDSGFDSEEAAPSWACNGDQEFRIQARFETKFRWLCLREYNIAASPLLARNSIFYVDRKRSMALRHTNITLVQGYTIGESTPGAAEGYLDVNGQFVGMLHYKDRTMYAGSITSDELLTRYRKFEHDYTPPPSGRNLWRQKRNDLDYEDSKTAETDNEGEKYKNATTIRQMSFIKPIRPTRTPKPKLKMTSPITYKMAPKITSEMTKRVTSQATRLATSRMTSPPPTTLVEIEIALPVTTQEAFNTETRHSEKRIEYSKESSSSSVPVYAFSTRHKHKHKHKTKHTTFPPLARATTSEEPTGKARLCELLIMADYTYYVHDAESNLDIAIKRMFHAISLVDAIFRNTDFDEDGKPDNIGFSVKYAMILTTMASHQRLFGELPHQPHQNGKDYLTHFAALRKLEDVCMGIAFTGYSFINSSIGLSFTSLATGGDGSQNEGGACDRGPGGLTFNILAVAHGVINNKTRVPPRLAGMALAHEMGHSFGAPHDNMFPQKECDNYLMSEHSITGDRPTHYKFSYCSRQLMRITIENSVSCLVYDDRPYCGNGIVEGDEACDCGLSANCAAMDRCCTPKAGAAAGFVGLKSVHVPGCSVAPSALCHPSQGRCCNRNCSFSDLSIDGVECSRMHDKCPCAANEERCSCGLGGECLPDGTCVAAECARLGLRECTCPHNGPGGTMAAANRCGVCCALPGSTGGDVQCTSAESAARRQLLTGRVLLEDLKEIDYNGPIIFFKICLSVPAARLAAGALTNSGCAHATLRAWYKDGVCLAHGAVGKCASNGVCVPPARPAANLYPIVLVEPKEVELAQNQKKKEHKLTAARSCIGVLVNNFKYFILLCAFWINYFEIL